MARSKTPAQMARDLRKWKLETFNKSVAKGLTTGMLYVQELARTTFILSGGKNAAVDGSLLTSRSGKLRKSIKIVPPKPGGSGAFGMQTGLTSSLVYAAIHEYGGTINHPGSVPRKASVLHWTDASGKSVFAMRTRPHVIRIPKRPYMKPALKMGKPHLMAAVSAQIKRDFRADLAK
jgi:phage gpG-like protein